MTTKKALISWQVYLGLVLLITGGLFLADQLLELGLMFFLWPLLIVLFGITFFVGMITAGKRGSGLAIPGMLLTVIGLILFVQNLYSLWVTWTYSWTLLISATGLGLLMMNGYLKRDGLRRVGGLLIGIGLVLFVLLGVFFEIILDLAGSDVQSGLFLGAGLVLLGLFLMFSRPLFTRRTSPEDQKPVSPEVVDGDFSEVDSPFESVETPEPSMDEMSESMDEEMEETRDNG